MHTDFKFLLVLMVMAAIFTFALFADRAESQPEYITCSNGTEVIHIAYPGMCPVGYWQL